MICDPHPHRHGGGVDRPTYSSTHIPIHSFLTAIDAPLPAVAGTRLEAVAAALQVAVLLGIEGEIRAFHPGYRLWTC